MATVQQTVRNRSLEIGSDRFGFENLFELTPLAASGLSQAQKDNLTATILSAVAHFPNGVSRLDFAQQRIHYGRNYIQLAPDSTGTVSPVAHAGMGPAADPNNAGVLKRWTITEDGYLLGPVTPTHPHLTVLGGTPSPFIGFDMIPSEVQSMIVSMLCQVVLMINNDT